MGKRRAWGDAAYSEERGVIHRHAPRAKGFVQTNTHRYRPLRGTERTRNRTRSKIQTKVEHAFLVLKQIFGWDKVRYRGLANQYVARRRLLAEAA